MKAESVRMIGKSQEGASLALPIHSLCTPDLAALQGSQGIATSLSALHSNLQSHAWQHTDGASQQNGAGQNAPVPLAEQSQHSSQHSPARAHSPNATAPPADYVSRPFDRNFVLSQQHSQQGSQNWDFASQQRPTGSDPSFKQQVQPPKRKLPFSLGLQPDTKRHSPGPDQIELPAQHCQSSQVPLPSVLITSAPAEINRLGTSVSAFASPQKSPLGPSTAQQLMSPSLLLVSHQDSPSHVNLAGQQGSHPVVSDGQTTLPNHWAPAVSAILH